MILIGAVGVSFIRVDSSRIKQFRPGHFLRTADAVLNTHFSGGSVLFLMVDGGRAGAMTEPATLAYIDAFQREIETDDLVGDTVSIVEIVARMNQSMHGGDKAWQRIPDTREAVAQYTLLYSISGDPGDYEDLIDYDDRYAQVMIFVREPGTDVAGRVVARASAILQSLNEQNPSIQISTRMAGPVFSDLRLQEHIQTGQLVTLAICVPTLIAIDSVVFGSLLFGVLSILPVLLSILLVYGLLGLAAVPVDIATLMLGGMTLGIGIDFAIHYLHRYRQARRSGQEHPEATMVTTMSAGRAIFVNVAVLIGGFLPMLAARFYPQMKLGGCIVLTMAICYLATMYMYPATLTLIGPQRAERL